MTGQPYDPCPIKFDASEGGNGGPGDPTNLTTGEHLYLPDRDIVVYNPLGPAAVYQRNYYSETVRESYGSPGLAAGWVDNFDVSIHEDSATPWGLLELVYPNLQQDTLSPHKDINGNPTGEFSVQTGGTYYATGVPSSTPGKWDSITITWKEGQVSWVFTPIIDPYVPGEEIYVLSRIKNRMGRYIQINRGPAPNYLLTTVTDDASPANTLLTFAYDGSNRLSSVTDAYGRKVTYSFVTDYFGGTELKTSLHSVSQIASSGATNPAARATYGYNVFDGYPAFKGEPHLVTITVPSPTGTGTSTQTVNFDTATGKASSLVDANGNQRVYTYLSGTTTKVEVKNSSSVVDKWWIVHFEPVPDSDYFRKTGVEDSDSNQTVLYYGNVDVPYKPTLVMDKSGKEWEFTYDTHCNLTMIRDPRVKWTMFDYDYANFRLGRLTSVEVFKPVPPYTRTVASYTYNEPSGLVKTVTTLKPGCTDGTEFVTTTYAYDWEDPAMAGQPILGNLWKVTTPGNNAASTITTVLGYLQDGAYSQSNKLGQPLTITDNLSHVTHFRYDARGSVISATDALGNQADYTYNIAGQPELTILPATP